MYDFLKGLRVLNLSQNLPGPYALHALSELGAEIINVEGPGTGDLLRVIPPFVDGIGYAYQVLHAGQKSIVLDLKVAESRSALLRLAETAQVFVESFRPGVVQRLGVDYETIRSVRPDVVYCSLSGFGQTGPLRDRPGHDINFVATAGLQDLGPLPGVPIADLSGGSLAAIAILAALHKGKGAYIDLSLADSALSWTVLDSPKVFHSGQDLHPSERFLAGTFACYRAYETADRQWLTVGALEPKFWQGLCESIGKPECIPLQWSVEDQPDLISAFEAIFRTRTRDRWVAQLAALPVAPALTLREALHHPHFQERGMIETFGPGQRRVAFPARFPGHPVLPASGAPALGEHNDELLH